MFFFQFMSKIKPVVNITFVLQHKLHTSINQNSKFEAVMFIQDTFSFLFRFESNFVKKHIASQSQANRYIPSYNKNESLRDKTSLNSNIGCNMWYNTIVPSRGGSGSG